MFYYEVFILGLNLRPLTYHSKTKLGIYSLVLVPLSKNTKQAIILKEVKKPKFQTLEILSICDEKFSNIQKTLAKFISYYYACNLGMVFKIFTPFKSSNFINHNFDKTPTLSPLQSKALNFTTEHKTSLIFGDTGSGKSEIYISLIVKELNLGKQVLFLMPEISLTPQMEKRLKEYFGDFVGVWHSKITPKKKEILLKNFEDGKIKLIAGARSALFLPFTNLSLIVVDEEHDDSYKSATKPRYNARDLAIFLASKFDIKVVLGSATPSLTTYKKQPFFRLKGTFFKSSKEIIYDENETEISPKILKEIKTCLENKNQAIVFLPTRANFKYKQCTKCGEIIKCPFCSVGMSIHKNKNALICHYCGYTTHKNTTCQKCGGDTFESKRMGTSEVLETLQNVFKEAKIAKFDKDEITTQRKLTNLLKDFNDKKIDILVGTQMLSKGHDYHNVKLAVIMGIDTGLAYADFRAREKTLALCMQIAGRAGRVGNAKVLIQTKQADFFKSYLDKYDEFLEDETEFREDLYPPFTKILRVLISHKDEKTANDITQKCLEIIPKFKDIEVIGHGKAVIEYIASKFRYEILLRSNTYKNLVMLSHVLEKIPNVEVDMDAIFFS